MSFSGDAKLFADLVRALQHFLRWIDEPHEGRRSLPWTIRLRAIADPRLRTQGMSASKNAGTRHERWVSA
jgi:hypothetical protein